MKLTSKIDLEVPARFVYDILADHDAWEREALQRGVEIERPVDMPTSGVGASWKLRFRFRGKSRKVLVRIEEMQPESRMALSFEGQALAGESEMDIIALSPRRTRLRTAVTVRPKTLAARLFLNTLRLAKRRVQGRLDRRLGQLGARIEDRFARSRTERV
ncbi:MAG: SRPBCC family protein [Tabrizicola sp.]|jgi:hypothetical protein|nr:SRPBCC family protein [Tabrizicola sp.]